MNASTFREWALGHRSLVVYFMLASSSIAGVASYLRLGRSEDPDFTDQDHGRAGAMAGRHDRRHAQAGHRAHRAQAPGDAEPRLPASYTTAGADDDLRQSEGIDARRARSRTSGIRCARRSAISATRLPQGVVGPGFNDEFGDTYGIVYGFTADGFTHRELRDYVEDVRTQLLQTPDVSKIDVARRPGRARLSSSSRPRKLAGARDRSPRADRGACRRRTPSRPAGVVQTGDEKILVRVSRRVPVGAGHPRRQFRRRTAGMIRLGDIAEVTRGHADPAAADVPRQRPAGASASPSPCATAATCSRSGATSSSAMAEITANLPVGIEPTLVANQPVTVEARHRRLHGGAVGGDRHRPGRQLRQPRLARRRRRRALDPAGPRRSCSSAMEAVGHRSAAHLAGRPHHRARPAGRRRDDHRRDRWSRGSSTATTRNTAASFAYTSTAFPMLDRHAGHRRRLRADRLRAQRRPANTRSRSSPSWRSRCSPPGSSRCSSRRCSASAC